MKWEGAPDRRRHTDEATRARNGTRQRRAPVLTAHDYQGAPVTARGALRNQPVFCPECGAPLRLRAGRFVRAHFAHPARSSCAYARESLLHLQMKDFAATWLQADLEVPLIPDRRADAVLSTDQGNRFVLECQASPITVDEIEARSRAYNDAGYPIMWWFSARRLNRHRGQTDEAAVPAELLEIERLTGTVNLFVHDLRDWPYDDSVIETPSLIDAWFFEAAVRESEWGDYEPVTLRRPVARAQLLPGWPPIPLTPITLRFRRGTESGITFAHLLWGAAEPTDDTRLTIHAFGGKT